MKKIILCILSLLFLVTALTACSEKTVDDAITIKVICESKELYQIYYTCYVDDIKCNSGGWADLDGGEITEKTDLSAVMNKELLEKDDISHFSIDFSPYGKNDTSEIATTDKIYIDAEYGKSYTIIFSGDREHGFKAELQTKE